MFTSELEELFNLVMFYEIIGYLDRSKFTRSACLDSYINVMGTEPYMPYFTLLLSFAYRLVRAPGASTVSRVSLLEML